MILLKDTEIPILQGQLTIDDNYYCVGVVEQGVIVQYMDIPNSGAVLIEWIDIIKIGEKCVNGHKPPVAIQPPKKRL